MTNYYQKLYEQDVKRPQPKQPKKRKPGCLIFLIIIIFMCGAGYIFLTLEPREAREPEDLSGPRIYGELSAEQQVAFDQLSAQSMRDLELQENAGTMRTLMLDVDMGYPNDPERQVQAFMREYQSLHQITDFDQQFRLIEKQITDTGSLRLKYSQWIDLIPVHNSQLLVVIDKSGNIKLINGGYLPEAHLSYDPIITYDKTEIIQLLNNQGYTIVSSKESIELVLYNKIVLGHAEGETLLAWTMDVTLNNEPYHVVVSVKTGEILIRASKLIFYNYQLYDANNLSIESLFDGEEYADSCHNYWQSISPIYATHEKFGPEINKDTIHLLETIHKTLSNYEEHLGWKGYNNKDHHFNVVMNIKSDSPFYLDLCGSVLIGFTDKASVRSAEDVFTHEFQHAVTEVRTQLQYSAAHPESAALDEGYSDIFTALVDTKRPWQVHWGRRLLRDMKNPGRVRGQVSHYDNFIRPLSDDAERFYSHQNSTIFSHAAYLIAEGGYKEGIRVVGIGIGDMTRIFFKSQESLMPTATLFDARVGVIDACVELYPDDLGRCEQVQNAFAIVGLGDPVPQPTLIDQLLEIIASLQDAIVEARSGLTLDLFDRLQDMNIQIDDFFLRMEEDLVNLVTELAFK